MQSKSILLYFYRPSRHKNDNVATIVARLDQSIGRNKSKRG